MVINDLATAIIFLLVGVATLLVGMRLMSNGLKRICGNGMKKFFSKTKKNPFASLGIGASVTAIIQSSDATNAMVIGFLNAGVMTLYQGICIMLGAYIGTTVTGVLASFSSLPISLYLLTLTFIGIVLSFIKNEKVKSLGDILTGLGLLFFALAVLKASFGCPEIKQFCESLFSNINIGIVLYLIGIFLAALVQSSSAITSIVIAMVGASALGLGSALYIVLGATVGTVVNTLLACIGGKIEGKRAAWIAFSMRILCSLIMLLFLCIFENQIASMMHVFAINGDNELPVAMFTVFYNIIFMPLMIPFINPFIKLFNKIIKDKEADELSKTIHFIDDKMLNTPSIALMQVTDEIMHMYDLAFDNYQLGIERLLTKNTANDAAIEKTEDKIDYLNNRITDFLIKLSSKASKEEEKVVGSYYHVINDIERIGDHAYNFLEMSQSMCKDNLDFSDQAKEEINCMNKVVMDMFSEAKIAFINKDKTIIDKLGKAEEITDEMKTKFYSNHYERVKQNKCTGDLTPYISSLIVELERVADHLTNIGYSTINPTGDQ